MAEEIEKEIDEIASSRVFEWLAHRKDPELIHEILLHDMNWMLAERVEVCLRDLSDLGLVEITERLLKGVKDAGCPF